MSNSPSIQANSEFEQYVIDHIDHTKREMKKFGDRLRYVEDDVTFAIVTLQALLNKSGMTDQKMADAFSRWNDSLKKRSSRGRKRVVPPSLVPKPVDENNITTINTGAKRG